MNHRLSRTALAVGLLVLGTGGRPVAAQTELPLSGPAFSLADEAYKAYARGDYARAVEKAREALRLRPDARQIQALLQEAERARAAQRAGAILPPDPPRSVPPPTPPNEPLPSSPDPAYTAAAAGYASYDRGDFAEAVDHAQRAVKLAPENRAYWLLRVNALLAANRLVEADQAITDGIRAAGDDGALLAQREPLRRRLAEAPAEAAYAALERNDIEAAVVHAEKAVEYAPTNRMYGMVLLHTLLQGRHFARAEAAATAAIALGPHDPSPLVLRADIRQRFSRRREAVADLELALRQPGISVAGQRNIRIIAADDALAAREPQVALDLLESLPETHDDGVARRRRAARMSLQRTRPGEMPLRTSSTSLTPPVLDCRKPDGPQLCLVLPGESRDRAFDIAVVAYKAFERKDFTQAAERAGRAVQIAPDNRDYQLLLISALFSAGRFAEAEVAASQALSDDRADSTLIVQRGFIRQSLGKDALALEDLAVALDAGGLPLATEIGVLADLGRKPLARRRFYESLERGDFAQASDTEIAYLAARVGDDDKALAAFNRADASGKLANTAYRDAAFTAVRAIHDGQATGYFARSIADAHAQKLALTPKQLFETRRAVSVVSRKWGLIASQTYRGAVSGLGLAPSADTLQAGVEGYLRPWGYRNGRYVELFARSFDTLFVKGGGLTFGDSLQTTVGIRHKVLRGANLLASFGRVFSSSGGRNDWLGQFGYSGGTGTDLRVDAPNWWTTRVYAEAGRYFKAQETYALAHGEAGRSALMGSGGGAWVLFPHLSGAFDYDSRASEPRSAGAGPGMNLTWWFHQDIDTAPRSTLELSAQYRFRLLGAQRAKGLFLTLILAY